ncbi:hypothetical protein RUM8411_03048 [Ruegeria meonggei]|uniref:Uncharacterized protein n=1 Tax=Ruegeria meonggei TaxID=1446476 RepID=A0A1X6ZUT7_9RHOB|nr:hypothetical protein RUM8411_03048 [Ruegeria meonggei]
MTKDVFILLLKLLAMFGCIVGAMLFVFFVTQRFLGEYDFLFQLVGISVALGSFWLLLYSVRMLKEEMLKIEKKHRPWLFDRFGNRL